jgi:hypothetical protein
MEEVSMFSTLTVSISAVIIFLVTWLKYDFETFEIKPVVINIMTYNYSTDIVHMEKIMYCEQC